MRDLRTSILAALLLLSCTTARAQEVPPREYVSRTFAGTQIINAQSVEVVPRKRSFGFMIQHRFGAIRPEKEAFDQLFGLDLPANIRFAFQYAPVNDMHLEIGRSKNGKTWDLACKVRLLKQTVENEVPVSVTLHGNVALMSDEFPPVNDRMYHADLVTPFNYRFVHRLSYNAQVIVARRFTEHFSLQLAPVMVYRNLVPLGEENLTLAATISGRLRVTTKGSVLIEASPILLGGSEESDLVPLAVGYEIATQGHVFQIVVASSAELVEQRLYTTPPSRYDEGYFHLGFNIARILYVKPKTPRP